MTDWISTPQLRFDDRGPTDRAFTPFGDPACAQPMVAMLRTLAAADPLAVAIDDGTSVVSRDALVRKIDKVRVALDVLLPAQGKSGEARLRVGVLLPPGIACSAAIFGTLAAGHCCVLLDSSFPEARNATIAEQTGISLLLTGSAANESPAIGRRSVWADMRTLDVDAVLRAPHDARAYEREVSEASAVSTVDSPAFILCTSGSSGTPKPIVHSQRTLLHWARTTHDSLHVTSVDRTLSLSSPSTLGGLTGLLGFLLGGAALQTLDIRGSGLAGLLNTLRTKPVTVLRAAPSMMRSLAVLPDARGAFAQLRAVQMYGEPLTKADVSALRRVLPAGCLVRTTYGSTEASGLCWFAGEPDEHDSVRVAAGALMPDTMAAIIDDQGQPCARGEPGDEYIIQS